MTRCWLHRTSLFAVGACLTLVDTPAVFSQAPVWSRESQIGQPLFEVRVYRRQSLSPDLVRADVVVEVAHDMLQFVREHTEFTASAELSLSLFSKKSKRVHSEVRRIERRTNRYEVTNSKRDFLTSTFTIAVPPGRYQLKVTLTDQETHRREIVEQTLDLAPPRIGELALSDLMLTLSDQATPGGQSPLEPLAGGTLFDKSADLWCYFDLRRPNPLTPCKLELVVIDQAGVRTPIDSLELIGGQELSSHFIRLPVASLPLAQYTVELRARCGEQAAVKSTTFTINYYGLPSTIRDLDQAIAQLRYIATEEEISRLAGEFPSRRAEAFQRFWDENFPCEGEAVNGKMVEYYSRIDYANQNFGNNREGWTTDRGQAYVLFGKPTEVVHQYSQEEGAYYEVWYYHHLNKRLVFRDEYGFGDYRLVSNLW